MSSEHWQCQLVRLGDYAWLVQFEQRVDRDINENVHRLKAQIDAQNPPWLRFQIPAYCSLAIGFDLQAMDPDEVKDFILDQLRVVSNESNAGKRFVSDELIQIPVCYCSACGMDLESVAQTVGRRVSEVIRLHHEPEYRAFMLGFMPGFAYLGTVDPRIQCPRRQIPRQHVPAGAVGIAGAQTGIYPDSTPAGWQILGRTATPLWSDWKSPNGPLIQPGTRVRFQPVSHDDFQQEFAIHEQRLQRQSSIDNSPFCDDGQAYCTWSVLRPGLHTTLQDQGRDQFRHLGIPPSGAMDQRAAQLANQLVGNPDTAPVLEATLIGPTFEIKGACEFAITGANLTPSLDGRPVRQGELIKIAPGSHPVKLAFGERVDGCRAYIAIAGRLLMESWLQSVSASPVQSDRLTPGARLTRGSQLRFVSSKRQTSTRLPMQDNNLELPNATGLTLSIDAGPELNKFSPKSRNALVGMTFSISSDSGRMGYRLNESIEPLAEVGEMISAAVIPGVIQVPGSGCPIILMRDAQVTGGYPRIAVVPENELNRLAQLRPGDRLRFRWR